MLLHDRHFALEEARAILKTILPDLSRLVELKQALNLINYDIYKHRYFGGSGPNGTGNYPKELDQLVAMVKDFAGKGVIVKGLDDGLIDFPHIRENGEEVYLCYKLGEEDILFWHPVEAGFAGRRTITEL